MSSEAQATIRIDGVKLGAFAFLLFAITALLANLILSRLLQPRTDAFNISQQRSPASTTKLAQAWTYAHIFFALSTFTTLFITSWPTGVVLIAYVGIPWAMTLWAPFAIIGQEIAAVDTRTGAEAVENQKGAIMSLHNAAISAPQMVAALACSAVFWAAREFGGGMDGTGWAIRLGSCAALGAAWLAWGL